MATGPAWLRAVVRAERMIAGPLNRAANSEQSAGALLLLAGTARLAIGISERARRTVVHVLALPSQRDVQLLEAKVERVQRALEDWSAEERDWRARSHPKGPGGPA